jgi:hypothetical protein
VRLTLLLPLALAMLTHSTRPWYVIAPVAFVIMLSPTWVAAIVLVAMVAWTLLQRHPQKRQAP